MYSFKFEWFLVAALLLAITSCESTQSRWTKNTPNPSNFDTARYECIDSSREASATSFSSIDVGPYFGTGTSVSSSGMIVNENLFFACMRNNGWSYGSERFSIVSTLATNLIEIFDDYTKLICSGRYEFYRQNTECSPREIGFAQVTKTTFIEDKDKADLLEVHRITMDYYDFRNRLSASFSSEDEPLNIFTESLIASDTYIKEQYSGSLMRLYNKEITWGEFNRERVESYDVAKKMVLLPPGIR
jgi:hypothetical protein